MQTAVRLTTTVLPGSRIEVTAPELQENDRVELIILRSEPAEDAPRFASALAYLDSLPSIERTPEEWAKVERELREERDSWDR